MFFDVKSIDELHQDVPGKLLRIDVVVKDADYVLVVNLVQELDFAKKVLEEFLSMQLAEWHVLFANKVAADDFIAKKYSLTARTLTEQLNEDVVSSPQKVND